MRFFEKNENVEKDPKTSETVKKRISEKNKQTRQKLKRDTKRQVDKS